MGTSGWMKTSAFHPSAPRKVGQDVRAFREVRAASNQRPAPPCGRMPPMSISGSMRTLASHASAQGKSDRMSELSVKSAAPPVAKPVDVMTAAELKAEPVACWTEPVFGRG